MAVHVRQIVVDDLDGSTEDVQTVRFAVQGREYAIDLKPDHRAQFDAALEPFIRSASRVPANRSTRRAVRTGARTADIRRWAADNGVSVGDRGRLPAEVIEAYERAQSV